MRLGVLRDPLLVVSPWFEARRDQVAARHGVTHQGAISALRRLADLGIVQERARNGRVSFTATEVVELLSR